MIASTYGFNLLPCLPGSIIHRRCFSKAGYFPNVRAGEDIDWIWRASKHNLILDTVKSPPLQYRLNPNLGIIYYARKWFRNYSCTTVLPYVFDGQRTTYVFFLFLAISFVSFVWNSLFANWNELSPLYVPFISRSVVLFLVFLYLILRCIYLPLTKGISFLSLFKYLFPILYLALSRLCQTIRFFALDFHKLASQISLYKNRLAFLPFGSFNRFLFLKEIVLGTKNPVSLLSHISYLQIHNLMLY